MIWIIVVGIVILIFVILNRRLISKNILSHFGWKPPSPELIDIMDRYKKIVIVYPHTSHYDGVLMVLYKLAYPNFGKNLKFLIRPDIPETPFFGSLLKDIGAIPSTFIDIKNGGRTKEIINYLNGQDRFQFLISPKGTIRKEEWKKGYYFITKGTGAHIMALGLDYKNKEIIFNHPFHIPGDSSYFPTEEYMNFLLKSQLKKIPQINPQNVEY